MALIKNSLALNPGIKVTFLFLKHNINYEVILIGMLSEIFSANPEMEAISFE